MEFDFIEKTPTKALILLIIRIGCIDSSVGILPQTVMLWLLFLSIKSMQNLPKMLLLMFLKQVFFYVFENLWFC